MIRLRPSARCSGTRSLIASARRDEVGVIYPNLPWLTRLNSHPINADRYLIDWRGLLGPFKNGIGGCALLPQLDRLSPRSIPLDCSVKRRTRSGHGVAAVVHLTRCAKGRDTLLCTPRPVGRVQARDVRCMSRVSYEGNLILPSTPLEFSAETRWIYKMGVLTPRLFFEQD